MIGTLNVFLISSKIGDKAFFGPEPEFFIFDNVEFKSGKTESMVKIDSDEDPSKNSSSIKDGNMGYRSQPNGAYFDSVPFDVSRETRAEIADLNKDGYPDLVINGYYNGSSYNTQAYIHWGDPDGYDAGGRTGIPSVGVASAIQIVGGE